MSFGLALSAMILMGSCGQAAPEARLGEEWTLKPGQAGRIRGEDLRIRFVSVTQDSRCPKGEQCIVAGNAAIALEISRGDLEPVSFQLNTSEEPQEVVYEGYAARLVDLAPYPVTGRAINSVDYLATVLVRKL
ncbi:MAG: hypothetical protein WD451_05480 [Thermoanaerobaculia bacterium]